MSFSVSINTSPIDEIRKQIPFAAAVALTQTAKDGQAGVQDALKKTFTIRSNWFEQSNKLGIRVKPATKSNLTAIVSTAAGFLLDDETGDDKLPSKKLIAIPTQNVRRSKRDIITKANRPTALRAKNTVILNTKSGPILFQRQGRGRNKRLVALYVLKTRAKIRKQSTFYEPLNRISAANFAQNFENSLKKAVQTAR